MSFKAFWDKVSLFHYQLFDFMTEFTPIIILPEIRDHRFKSSVP